jgi:gliding motility-associated-like protein
MKLIYLIFSIVIINSFNAHGQCFEIESILVDACGTPEGENEMVRFKVGSQDLCTNDLSVNWPNNNWLGLVQDATTAQAVADLNNTIVSCGFLLEPVSCLLPANSTVLLITSSAIDVTANSFANLSDTLFVIFQAPGNTSGHFANYNSAGGLRTLIMNFSNPANCADTVTYDRGNLININGTTGGTTADKNGATVEFDVAGNPTYINNGCQAPITPFFIDMTASEVNTGTQSICPTDTVLVNVNISGAYQQIIWSGGTGSFDGQNVNNTSYFSSINDTVDFYLFSSVITICNDTIKDSVLININSTPTITSTLPTLSTFSGQQQLTANMTGGVWTSNCGACLSNSGVFDPSVSGEGTFNVCYFAGCGQDCINIVVDNSCTMTVTPNPNNPQCYGNANGSLTLSVTGVVGSPIYIIEDANQNQLNSNNSTTANNLAEGWYFYTVSDDLCTISDSIFLDDPDSLIVNYTVQEPKCFGIPNGLAFIDTVINAQGAYNNIVYTWVDDANNIISNDSLFNIGDGVYTLTVTDQLGCVKINTFVVNYPQPVYIDTIGITKKAICRVYATDNGNGQIFASPAGGLTSAGNSDGTNFTNTSYWQENATGITHNSYTWGNLNPGYFTFYAINEYGCQADTTIFLDSISPIAQFSAVSPQFSLNYSGTGDAEVTFNNLSQNYNFANDPLYNTTGPYDIDTLFSWYFDLNNDPNITESLSPITKIYPAPGTYTVCLEVTENLNHCVDSTCIKIELYDIPKLIVPNTFTPDNDGVNDYFYFPSSAINEFKCVVFDRWGRKVFEFNDISDQWDGTNMTNGKLCSNGVYFFTYEGVSSNGTKYKGQGNVELLGH